MSREDLHSISLLVNNKPGVLIRISLVFARRGYNIDSLVVSPAHNRQFSRMSITASGDPDTLVLILGQLNKLVDVIHATDHTGDVVVQRELALIKVDCTAERRTEVLQISEHFKCQSVDISDTTVLLEATGNSDKLDALELMLEKHGIVEIVRSGKLVMARGASAT
ncbi:MAG: acetolactate synthase small subunit [Lentisphaeria bacterium]|jgi:acetolactate synthase-1/3 small subunit|nr:acetolactate synthase small subunit [Lentisphaeria bacterium]